MKLLSDFRRKVRLRVRQCPTVIIDEAIRDAAIEFCHFTYTWREELDAIRVRDGVSDYEIDAPPYGRLNHILYVSHSGVRIMPTSEQLLDDTESGWRTSEAKVAQWYYSPDKETIRIALTPTETESRALSITATFKPKVDAIKLPNHLYDDHLEAISNGALMRLFEMSGEAWENAPGSALARALFDKAKMNEKAERLNDYNRTSSLTIRPINYYD